MIKPETVQRIIDTSQIVEVVSDFVSLKKRGANFIGLCPFHNEKTPSFHVSASKGIFKCFGCGKGGNSVSFVMEHEHYSYVEALKYLANKYSIEVEEVEMSDEMKAELSERETNFAINQFAQKFFTKTLFESDEGKQIALTYFKEREFSIDTLKKFQVGFSPSSWDAFILEATKNGYTKEQLVKSGLVIEKEGRYYDRFRERVIFPIHNISGRVLGFGGRILSSEKSQAKYINSPESDIYNKSKILYGINFAKNQIVKEDNCLLVEGYTDVLSMNQAGIENVVASSGTSLTTEQIRLIKKFTSNITIIYDGDPAGIKASLRGIGLILSEDMNVKVVLLPEPEDPDSFVKKNRSSEVQKYFEENAQNFILFKTKLLLSETENDPIRKSQVISEIIDDIALIPNQITRAVYVKECSALFEISENSLIGQLNKILTKKFRSRVKKQGQDTSGIDELMPIKEEEQQSRLEVDYYNPQYQEGAIIHILLNYGTKNFKIKDLDENNNKQEETYQVATYIISDLTNDEIDFTNALYAEMFLEYKNRFFENDSNIERFFTSHENEEIRNKAIDFLSFPYDISDEWKNKHNIETPDINDESTNILQEMIFSSLLKLKLRRIEMLMKDIENSMKEETDYEEIVLMMQKHKSLGDIRLELTKHLNIIVTH
ncbi:MAG: DNA primase [Bacteroidales bacterium]|nr:DNA primase [Bacteroidales bacterium]